MVALESEVDLAKSYLELEKIRFEERLTIIWELSPGLEQFQIPPFALQMLVENAIKHGISNLRDGGVVRVRIHEDENTIFIEVKNSGNLEDVVDLGVGIENIRQRLLLQYGEGASFELKEENNFVYATMKFTK